MAETPQVVSHVSGRILRIELNRPEAINSLNLSMVKDLWQLLKNVDDDENIAAIVLSGRGEKGFCAGGDVKSVCLTTAETLDYAKEFFRFEYLVDELLSRLGKPVIAFGHGITMGGGLGLFMGSSYRVAFKNSLFAMPETAIGFFPDVGATYFLQKVWNQSYGKLAALSGARFNGADAVHIGCATHLARNEDFTRILMELVDAEWTAGREENHGLVKRLLGGFHCAEPSNLRVLDRAIENIFSHPTLEETASAWSQGAKNSLWLQQAWLSFESGSPRSRKLIWRQLQQNWSRTEAAIREWDIAIRFCQDSDFREGVRAVLVDKDKNPHWKHRSVNDVSEQEIEVLLTPIEENPLLNYFSATI